MLWFSRYLSLSLIKRILFMFQFSDPFHFDTDPDPDPTKMKKRPTFFYFNFLSKIYFSKKNDFFCYLWGKYLCPLKKTLIFSKNVWYSYDFFLCVEISRDFGWFFATRIRFFEADLDPDPADQNEPDPKHWFLVRRRNRMGVWGIGIRRRIGRGD